MGLLTLQTQLTTVLQAATDLKQYAYNNAQALQSDVSLGYLLHMQSYANDLINNVCEAYSSNTALATYADTQFAQSFELSTRIAGIQSLLQSVSDTITSIVTPYAIADLYTDTTIVSDGVAVTAPTYTPDQTLSVSSTLQTIYNEIPD